MPLTIHAAAKIATGIGPVITNAVLAEEDGIIQWISYPNDPVLKKALANPTTRFIDHKDGIIVPGFIDIHTHGALGTDFVDADQEALSQIAIQLAKEGSTSFVTSLMTLPHDQELEVLTRYGELKTPIVGSRWIGIHNEGPYLSLKFKAMMQEEGLRPIRLDEIEENQNAAQGKIKMVTVAPESEHIEAFIDTCHRLNIAVMFAHTDATATQTLHALKAGGDGFTHLYNAMTQHTHRNPGAVTAALLKGNSFCELIVDGYHIDPLVVKLTYQIIGSERLILITDSNPGKGLGDGDFMFGGKECVSIQGKAYTKADGRIAGSTIGMIDAFRNILNYTGCDLIEAVQMASVNPAKLLKMTTIGSLKRGNHADFNVLSPNYDLRMTFREGQPISSPMEEQ